jgi:hypothetical protein
VTSDVQFALVTREGEADVIVMIVDDEKEAQEIAAEVRKSGRRPVGVHPYRPGPPGPATPLPAD